MNHSPKEYLSFFKEIESLKTVQRQNQTMDGRYENAAEHSWQLAIMAPLLQSFFQDDVNLETVMLMLLIHDIGEIGAGDTSVFDEEGKATSYQRELFSVQQTLGYLPDASRSNLLALWKEFETGTSPEARYARVIDAFAPLMNHYFIAQDNDNPDDLTKQQVLAKKAFIEQESPDIWQLVLELVAKSVDKGLYSDDDSES
ncbi:HD domain-containing protein [Streptococcus moroccensis]|uniref:Hydrolase of HD superfamily n=1 Tax=Streptococcus moroccensis TaxID=1451356 RepID=A0ABT9YPL0_9STRE|nr:HD domain-containing protein [Streptococcus moroccensis]MDQ0221934.1 putative hydrolase of HD superfamily [Streptococcus moroccensis]